MTLSLLEPLKNMVFFPKTQLWQSIDKLKDGDAITVLNIRINKN